MLDEKEYYTATESDGVQCAKSGNVDDSID